MAVETYSHVMHIVSNVAGELRPERRARSTRCARSCPAGTLSGAPKVRAMQIIDELEPVKRGGLRRRGRLAVLRRRPRHLHLHPHRRGQGRHRPRAGGRRHRRRRQARLRVRGVARQGARRRAGDRAGREAARVAVSRVLVVDNYDSFTYNLVQYLGELGAELEVVRNDAASVDDLLGAAPGPRRRLARARARPTRRASRSRSMRRFPEAGVPTLGVCLGHQSLAQAFGGKVIRHVPVHGKTTEIEHDGTGLFAGLPSPLTVGRYHSLVVDPTLPDVLEPTACGRRRADGDAPPRAAGARRPVPPRVRADARRHAAAGELPSPNCPTPSSPQAIDAARHPPGPLGRRSRRRCWPRSWAATRRRRRPPRS